ncbi:MAG: ATP-binding protein [Candidatus Parabeggiatoa sp.]|nr:ATP-binding protein [Candidatus Parabeggiatoa sp.]
MKGMSLTKKQHEGFAQFFEKPTRETLRSLIKDNIGETNYLDFKESWISFPKLAKHILAFSNTEGGAIIVGIKENDDGTTEPVGINELLDKEKISKGLSKYLPANVLWDVFDFVYEESEYPKLKGKKFQVLLVEYDPQLIPFLCLKAGDGIKENVVYVRSGTTTTEATHDDLQRIVNERIETGYSSKHVLDLSEHLQQLKELYKQKEVPSPFSTLTGAIAMMGRNRFINYHEFISELIIKKKQKIIDVLAL